MRARFAATGETLLHQLRYLARVRPATPIDRWSVADVVHELVPTHRALAKLAARNISFREATQLSGNRHVVARNPSDPERRRLLTGATDGGRVLTLVIEQTVDPTTWLVVTGWSATLAERRIVGRR